MNPIKRVLASLALAAWACHQGILPAASLDAESAADLPDQLELYIGQYTVGGCATICEDIGYCTDFDVDLSSADCTLRVETKDPRFRALLSSCPEAAKGAGVDGAHDGASWSLVCAP